MVAPFYNKADQAIYEGGNKFIPQEKYRLGPYTPPAIMGQNTNAGIASTNIAQPYKPPYIWPPQGGGDGGGGGGNIFGGYDPNQNLGPKNITDYEADAYGVGSTWAGSLAKLKDDYSNLWTPTNLLRKGWKGIQNWRAKKKAEKAQAAADEITAHNKAAADQAAAHTRAQTRYEASKASGREGGGWYGGADYSGGKSGDVAQAGPGRDPEDRMAQGGRIGFKEGLSAYQLFKLKELGYPGAGSNPGGYGGLGVLRDILKLHKYKHGGRIGYQNGEFVEDVNVEGPGYDENIEEVQGEPSREQLEAIALEIFQLPLEQLDEEQLMIVYQAAMEQEPSEEEVQFAAQEGQNQGLAGLV